MALSWLRRAGRHIQGPPGISPFFSGGGGYNCISPFFSVKDRKDNPGEGCRFLCGKTRILGALGVQSVTSRDGCGARSPLLAFFGRGPAAVPSSLPDPVDSASGGPAPDSLGEGGGIGSYPLPSPGGRATSPWSANRARTRGLSIVFGSPSPSAGSSSGSGRRGPPCRRSRRPGCHRGGSSPGGLIRPDSTRRGRVSSSDSRPLRQLTPSPSWGPPASALRLAGGPVIGSRHLPSPTRCRRRRRLRPDGASAARSRSHPLHGIVLGLCSRAGRPRRAASAREGGSRHVLCAV